jgi:DNA-binding MarR family transcriptional regulator
MARAQTRNERIEEIVRLLPQRNNQLVRLLTRAARLPLPRGMASLLTAVAEQPRSITQLADGEGLAQPTVTRMIARLESIGLVERSREARDRRIVTVTITPAGRRMLNELRARYRAVFREELADSDDEELEVLVNASRALQRLIDAMQAKALVTTAGRPGRLKRRPARA